MSVQSEIDRIKANVADAYAAVAEKGGAAQGERTSAGLAEAVRSIPDSRGLNLLDNWYFADPVNQRGKTKWTAGPAPEANADPNTQYGFVHGGHTIDRFVLQNMTSESSMVKDSGCIRLFLKNNDGILQKYEAGRILHNTDYTCSVLTKDGSLLTTSLKTPAEGSGLVNVVNYPGTIWFCAIGFFDPNTQGYVWPIITYDQESPREIDIVAVKLELGSQQTLARQDADGRWVLNDPPPNKALELLKCQRYQVVYSNTLNIVAVGFASNATSALVKISCPTLRATPALSFERLYLSSGAHAGANSILVTSVTDVFGDNGSYYVQFKCGGGLTTGECVAVQIRGGYLILDANI